MARRPLSLLAVLASATLLSGCLTGERPTLVEDSAIDAPTGDADVDRVLELLAGVDDATFTATYRVTNNFGPVMRDATVSQRGPERSVTIGDVRFLIAPSSALTCTGIDEVDGSCTNGIDDAAISDLQITHQFYGRSAASRLRTDARRRVGSPEGFESGFGGQDATCVTVPVSGGAKVYCALAEGALASYQGPDVLVELTSFEPRVTDDALFAP